MLTYPWRSSCLALILLLTLLGLIQTTAQATTIVVTTTIDELNNDGDCALREAIQAANTDQAIDACLAGSGADQIRLAGGVYSLTLVGAEEDANATGDLDLSSAISLAGRGADQTTLNGNQLDRVLQIAISGTVEITGVTISNGLAPAASTVPASYVAGRGEDGGGILNQGTLQLDHVIVRDNQAGNGRHSIEIFRPIGGGAGYGGGIANQGSLTLTYSSVVKNQAGVSGSGYGLHYVSGASGGGGGGIYNAGTLFISHSTVSNNHAPAGERNGPYPFYYNLDPGTGGSGGGIFNQGMLTMTHVTISANSAGAAGVLQRSSSEPGSNNVTLFIGVDGVGGGLVAGDHTALKNTLLAGNYREEQMSDCVDVLISYGFNLLQEPGCRLEQTDHDQVSVEPNLLPLANYGGTTPTHALAFYSHAVDQGSCTTINGVAVYEDQRHVARPQGAGCDIGAYELAPPVAFAYLPLITR